MSDRYEGETYEGGFGRGFLAGLGGPILLFLNPSRYNDIGSTGAADSFARVGSFLKAAAVRVGEDVGKRTA